VFAASIAAPSFRDAKLAGFRFLYRGYNIADSVDVLIYDAGASTAWYTNTLNVDTSEVVHVYSVAGFNRPAAPRNDPAGDGQDDRRGLHAVRARRGAGTPRRPGESRSDMTGQYNLAYDITEEMRHDG
jgi:hypothetical protein